MPIAIVFTGQETIPAILKNDTDNDLREAVAALKDAPDLPTVEDAREWLRGLPEPSGWFQTTAEALAYTEQLKSAARASGAEVEAARKSLGMSRAELAERIGIGGNSNTRHKFLHEVERGKKELSVPATRAMRAVLAEVGLAASE